MAVALAQALRLSLVEAAVVAVVEAEEEHHAEDRQATDDAVDDCKCQYFV